MYNELYPHALRDFVIGFRFWHEFVVEGAAPENAGSDPQGGVREGQADEILYGIFLLYRLEFILVI